MIFNCSVHENSSAANGTDSERDMASGACRERDKERDVEPDMEHEMEPDMEPDMEGSELSRVAKERSGIGEDSRQIARTLVHQLGLILLATLASPLWAETLSGNTPPPGDAAYKPGDCVALEGKATQGGLLWGQVSPGAAVAIDDTEVPVLPDGSFVIGLGRNAPANQTLVVNASNLCVQEIAIKPRDYRIQRVEGVPQKTVTPPQEELDRIAREREWVRTAKAQRIERPDILAAVRTGMAWPAIGPISGVYGSQRVYNGTPGSPHYGVDVAVPKGHPVVAPAPGIVTLAQPDLFYSGGTVILDHGYGLSSSFLHMSAVLVEVGDELKTGDLIGKVGATGRATGPHLDWRMSWMDERVDPQLLVPPMPAKAK